MSILDRSTIIYEGKVQKKGDYFGFNERFLVVTRGTYSNQRGAIHYFDNAAHVHSQRPKKSYTFQGCVFENVPSRDKVTFQVKPRNGATQGDKPVLVFAVPSTRERDEWRQRIELANQPYTPQQIHLPRQLPQQGRPRQQQEAVPVRVRCPSCQQVVQPPAGAARCRCPHCNNVMGIPQETQQQLLQMQQRQRQQHPSQPAQPPRLVSHQQQVQQPQQPQPQQQQQHVQYPGMQSTSGPGAPITSPRGRNASAAASRRAAREEMLRETRQRAAASAQILVRCPRCMRPVAPPPHTPQCRCPYCQSVMAIPDSTQRQLIEQQQRAAAQAALGAGATRGGASSPGGAQPPPETGQRWVKRVRTEDNVVVWLPTQRQQSDRSSGRVRAKTGTDLTLLERVEEDGHVRKFTPPNPSQRKPPTLDFVGASEGYNLVLLPDGSKPEPRFLHTVVSAADGSFSDKQEFFRDQIRRMRIPWQQSRQKIQVRRSDLLGTSYDSIMRLKAVGGETNEFHNIWRFVFEGEEGIDAGGLTREWFSEISKSIFSVDFGLFSFSGEGSTAFQISPHSGMANERHLNYFYFIGRLIGKALFDQQTLHANLVRPLFKHMVGAPLTFSDIEDMDPEFFINMKKMLEDPDTIEYIGLDFTYVETIFGESITKDLKEGGADIDLTKENAVEYVQLQVRRIMFSQVEQQLKMLLAGLYEVVPQHLLFMFDHQELELLLCGVPEIDVDDWERNTVYKGHYNNQHQVVKWFWEAVREWDQEERAKLLQFATGTSKVPAQGFAAMQSYDGTLCPFCIESITKEQCSMPRTHTCFNRIDLPMYDSYDELDRMLSIAVNYGMTGFDME